MIVFKVLVPNSASDVFHSIINVLKDVFRTHPYHEIESKKFGPVQGVRMFRRRKRVRLEPLHILLKILDMKLQSTNVPDFRMDPDYLDIPFVRIELIKTKPNLGECFASTLKYETSS